MSETDLELVSGGCLCGAVRYVFRAVPWHLTHCHCETCRRSAGAPFVSWLTVKTEALSLQGEPNWFVSSDHARRGFCGNCGTQLLFQENGTDEIDVTIASLDQPEAVSPEDHTFTRSRLAWIQLSDGLAQHPGPRT